MRDVADWEYRVDPVLFQEKEYAVGSRSLWQSALVTLFFLAHVPIGVIGSTNPQAAALHAAAVLAFGIWAAVRSSMVAVLCTLAYIAGAEVFWRMVSAPIPWEFAKYAIALISSLALLRMGTSATWRVLPLVYLFTLVPSSIVVLSDSAIETRQTLKMLSLYLSGPLALATCVMLCSQVELTPRQKRLILLAYTSAALAIVTITLVATYQAGSVSFTGESNLATSGGFGPNQVSAVLGIAALLAMLCALNSDASAGTRIANAMLAAVFAIQSAMTFSRGGLYTTAGALVVGCSILLRDRRLRRGLLLPVVLIGIAAVAVLPQLDVFTHGALEQRFQSLDPTKRQLLILDDLRLWSEFPLLGVGPGGSRAHRGDVGGAGHTEYSRMLAEHGLLGLLSLAALLAMALYALRMKGSLWDRSVRVSLLIASLLSMSHGAMRIASYSLLFGLAMLPLVRTESMAREPYA